MRRTAGLAVLVLGSAVAVGGVVVSLDRAASPIEDGIPAAVAPAPSDSLSRAASDADTAGAVVSVPQRPLLLVPGWLDTGRDMAALRIRFIAAGWPAEWVETLTFDDPTGENRHHAEELHQGVVSLLDETGADSVDIVAHSMGGLATRWYLLREDAAPVRRVVFIATPHRGTMAAHLAWGESREEMLPDSPFLDTLNLAPVVPEGVEAITIRTQIDTHVIPGESATLPGTPDHEICCPTHRGMLDDPEVFRLARRFLERGASGTGR